MFPIRRLLVRHLVGIQLPVVAILLGLVWWGSRSLMLNLAEREGQSRLRIAAEALDRRLSRVEHAGRMVEAYWQQGRIPFEDTGSTATLLMPWLSTQEEVQLLNLLDEQGRSLLLAWNPEGWKAREIRLDGRGGRELRWRDIGPDGRGPETPWGNSATYDARRRGWYQEARGLDAARWSTPYRLDPPERKLVVTWLEPLRNPAGQVVGALGLDLPAHQMKAFLEVLRPTPGSRLWVLDQSGAVLAEAPGPGPGEPTPERPALPEGPGHRVLRSELPARAGARWSLLIAIPEADLLAPIQRRLFILSAVASLLLALPLLWGLHLGRRLARSVQQLATAAEHLGPEQAPELPNLEVAELQTLGHALERAHGEFQTRLQLQQQLQHHQRIETLGNLAGGIAHDVNNHLAAILGQLFLAREGMAEGNPALPRLRQAEEIASRCARTTKTLLTFSRQGSPDLVPLDLNELLRASADLLGRALGEHVRISLDLDPARPRIAADPMQLELALTNLAVNARDAMPDGGLLRFSTRVQPDGRIRLQVSDTGAGIPAEHLPRIFEPFFTTKPVGQGTGLGLSMVFGILDAHGGHISVDSEPGRGTRFTLEFPAAPGPQAEPAPAAPRSEPRPLAGRRILVAEDEVYLRETLEEALAVAGAEVHGAGDGAEAWHLFQQHPFDCVLSDQRMPQATGTELLARIRATGATLPFILASGQDLEAFRALQETDPGLDLLAKPFSIATLLERMRRLQTC